MEHSRTEYHGHHEEECDSRVEGVVDDSKHLGLREGTDKSENVSNEVEFSDLQQLSMSDWLRADDPTFVENGNSRRKLPIKAWKARYVQLRIA